MDYETLTCDIARQKDQRAWGSVVAAMLRRAWEPDVIQDESAILRSLSLALCSCVCRLG